MADESVELQPIGWTAEAIHDNSSARILVDNDNVLQFSSQPKKGARSTEGLFVGT